MATLNIIEREGMNNAATVGAAALARLGTWVEKYEIVGDVRGRGLMIGIEIVEDKQSRKQAGPLRDRIVDLAFERGLLLLGCGENTVRLCPPLIVTQEETDVALDILECVLEECVMLATR
jgi:4-aminobutyrate aminotransferase